MANYHIEKYQYKKLKLQINNVNYRNPLVWSFEQKRRFLESISKGFPFGTFLFYRYKVNEKYTLVDGRQRYKALQEYSISPEKYFPFEGFGFIDALMTVINDGTLSYKEHTEIKAKITSLIKDLIHQEASEDKPKAFFLSKKLKELYPLVKTIKNSSEEICDIQAKILRKQREYINLETLLIPCVIFNGKESELQEVFATVNS